VSTRLNYRHSWSPIFLSFSHQKRFSSSMAFKPHQFPLNQFPFLKCEFGFKRKRWKHKRRGAEFHHHAQHNRRALILNHYFPATTTITVSNPNTQNRINLQKVTKSQIKITKPQILTTLNPNHPYTAESSTQINNTHVFRTEIQPTHHTNSIQNHHTHKPQKTVCESDPVQNPNPSKHPHKGSFFSFFL